MSYSSYLRHSCILLLQLRVYFWFDMSALSTNPFFVLNAIKDDFLLHPLNYVRFDHRLKVHLPTNESLVVVDLKK